MKYNITLKGFVAIMLLCTAVQVSLMAQDTLRISLPEAEKQFLEKNLNLLVEKYNIDIAKAQLIQAKLYSNPNLGITGNLYNPQEKKPFDISNNTGEYIIDLQQVARLAGKRNKEINLAETNIKITETHFYDLLRTLRFYIAKQFFLSLLSAKFSQCLLKPDCFVRKTQ